MLQPAPGLTPPPEPSIVIEGTKLNNVECFTYLGSTLTSTGSMDREVSNRLAKAGASFGRLWTRVWRERGIKLPTKLAVYRAVVMTSLLYGCETWALYRKQLKTLDQFHLRCLRKIMGISWEDRVSLGKTGYPTLKCCTEPTCLESRHSSLRRNWGGSDMWFEWTTRAYQRWSSSQSWPLAPETLDAHSRDSRIAWKHPWGPAAYPHRIGKLLP